MRQRLMQIMWFVLAMLCVSPGVFASEPIDADLVLIGGTLHLGDGSAAFQGDVAIRGDKIVAVGKFEHGNMKRRVNCQGLVICPGFIDLHNHSDNPVQRKETRAVVNYLTQGCTTIVTGNCGSGPIRVGAYYEKLDQHGVGVNVAHLLPQGTLRREVMQTERREANGDELDQMSELARKAMQDGAWGMSTGLIYVPSSYADTKELSAIAAVIGEHQGIYVSHIRGEGTRLLEAVREALEIGRAGMFPYIFRTSSRRARTPGDWCALRWT